MNKECIDIGQIAGVMQLPDDDPRRRHLEECPRCASQLLMYQRFLDAEEVPGADPGAADAHLAAVMKRAIHAGSAPDGVRGKGGFFTRMTRAILERPAWGAAAAVLLLAVVMAWWQPWTTEQTVLRGDTAPVDFQLLQIVPPDTLEDGGIRLIWRALENAESYVVRFRNPNLDEIALFGPFADTSLVIRRGMLPEDAPSVVLWRVVALRKGDEIGRSRPASLEFP